MLGFPVWAEDTEADLNQVKEIDLSEERPGPANGLKIPNHILLMLDLNKVKAGQLAKVVFYQFSKRVRVEFEAAGLPKGEYILAVAAKCSPAQFGKSWTELHRFKSDAQQIQTEKSLPKATLREGKADLLVLGGKSLGLFRVKPAQLVDCKAIE